jgi:hypothetical protein
MAFGPAPGTSGELSIGADGGNGRVNFVMPGVANQWVIERSASVSYFRGDSAFINIISNTARLYLTGNSYFNGTSFVAAVTITNDFRVLGHNVASNAFWVATNSTTGGVNGEAILRCFNLLLLILHNGALYLLACL